MRTYRAAPSRGSLWIAGMALLMVAFACLGLVIPGVPWVGLLTAAIFAPFALFSALLAMWLPAMRYELGDRELILRCGPIRYVIPLGDIQKVAKRDLALNPISSVRGPGYALFRVPYADVGTVTMCATRSLKDIILITTGRGKFGITPLEEDDFLLELTRRLEQADAALPG
ncbi:MAG: PH domain-containing protein [bacterium]|nr:PH domain-containing protein [bacterium]